MLKLHKPSYLFIYLIFFLFSYLFIPDECFSWQAMAQHDLPAFIDFVLEMTGAESVPVVAHSQGTLMTFAHSVITNTTKVNDRFVCVR